MGRNINILTPVSPRGKNPTDTQLWKEPRTSDANTKKTRTSMLMALKRLLTLADISTPDARSTVSSRQMAAATGSNLPRPVIHERQNKQANVDNGFYLTPLHNKK